MLRCVKKDKEFQVQKLDNRSLDNVASQISIAVGAYDRTAALLDGSVQVEGFSTDFIAGDLEEIFAQAFSSAPFGVTELSFSNFLISSARGICPYIALPIFPSRSFRHSAIYLRSDAGINSPADLRGKRIGTREYSNTLSLVVRGILADEYGVYPDTNEWLIGDIDHVERQTIDSKNWPINSVSIKAVVGRPLSSLMVAGELDVLISYTPPEQFGKDTSMVRLFPEWRTVEQDYFQRTRRFPVMHIMGIRRDVLAAHPTLSKALLHAFDKAKQLAQAQLAVHQALPVMLPWMTSELQATESLMGQDFWQYGLEANREILEAQIRWSFEQGLIPRRPPIEELFVNF
jgi:4,5-dihydroxyphthalate decarboxylase